MNRHPYEEMTELESSFRGDVYLYMLENKCTKQEAERVIEKEYKLNGWFDS